MPKRNSSFTAPFLAWNRVAWKTGEMMLASAQVIHHRTGRMAAAGAKPSARDRREFALMGQEKIDAGVEAAFAMAAQWMRFNPFLSTRALSLAAARVAHRGLRPVHSRAKANAKRLGKR